jgi:hypothetical protein
MYFTYAFYKDLYKNKFLLLLSGAFCSIVFTLWIDQGVYVVSAFVFLLLVNFFLKKKFVVFKNIQILVQEFILFICGLIIGAIPLLIYLLKFGMLTASVRAFLNLSEMPILAKTPFFLNLFSPDNVFTISILIIGIYYLVTSLLFNKNKTNLISYLLIGLIFDLIFFEQKGLIRSISDQITFVPFIILMVIVYDLFTHIKKSKINMLLIYCLILFLPIIFLNLQNIRSFKIPSINTINLNYQTCFKRNLNSLVNINDSYQQVVNTVNSYKDFNGKILSFPGDPIFYVLFKQRLPYFTSIYEASSINDQKVLVNFIERNKIKYVIVNMDNKAIQDTVPNYIRGSYELSYLMNNFAPKTKIKNFLILQNKPNQDWLKSEILTKDFKDYLLNVNFEKILQSEGKYKFEYLNSTNTTLVTKINNDVDSKNLILILTPSMNTKNALDSQIIISSENISTTIKFKTCTNSSICILNVSKIPLFYKNRKIDSIKLDNNYDMKLLYGNEHLFNLLW